MPLGLSSLGRCEGRVLANIDAVIAALARIAGAEEVIAAIAIRGRTTSTAATVSSAGTRTRCSGAPPGSARCGSW